MFTAQQSPDFMQTKLSSLSQSDHSGDQRGRRCEKETEFGHLRNDRNNSGLHALPPSAKNDVCDRLFHSHLSETHGHVACYASTSESPLASEKIRNNSSRSKKRAWQWKLGVFTEPGIIQTWLSDLRQNGRNVIGRELLRRRNRRQARFSALFFFRVSIIWGPLISPFREKMGCKCMAEGNRF
jgi:hypothetical protein